MHSKMLMTRLLLLGLLAGARAQQVLPASHGPPAGADPISYGWYATPEIQQPIPLDVVGTIPDWINGSLYRGAAGTWDTGNLTAEHWFDGFSRNHRFEIANGKVEYRSRNASDELLDFVKETGLYPDGDFGSDPCKIVFGAFAATYRDGNHSHGNASSDNIPVGWVVNYPNLARNTTSLGGPFDTLVMTTDSNALQQIDPVTLEPIEVFTYQASDERLETQGTTGSHPAYGFDETIYNYILNETSHPPEYTVFGLKQGTAGAQILATVTDAPAAYIHTLFGSENYLVLIIWQADFGKKATTVVGSLLPWNPERKTLFYVIDKHKGGVISKYISDDAFFAFHSVNAFEDDSGAIVLDIPCFKDHSFLEAAHVSNLRANIGPNSNGSAKNDAPANFTRYVLPNLGADAKLANGSLVTHKAVKAFQLDYATANFELPHINGKYHGKAYRYAYGIHTVKQGYFADSIIKIDTHTQKPLVWNPTTNHLPSEPVFIAKPGAVAEDDGVLLTVAMDAARKKSSMVVINATTMVELGRAQLPIVMGYGFHGVFGEASLP